MHRGLSLHKRFHDLFWSVHSAALPRTHHSKQLPVAALTSHISQRMEQRPDTEFNAGNATREQGNTEGLRGLLARTASTGGSARQRRRENAHVGW